jgi:hypothetical protein
MMRLASVALVAVVVAFPLAVLPAAPVTWLAGAALLVGGAGALVPAVPLVTAGASLALIAYALALVIVRPAADPVTAITFGVTLVLLLALVHLAGRVDGAALGPSVIVSQIRDWLSVVAAGVLTAAALAAGGTALAAALQGVTLPMVVVAATVGAVITMAGIIALVTSYRAGR